MEFRWALAAFLGVLVFGTLQGIVVAIALSLIGLASQSAKPRVHVIGRSGTPMCSGRYHMSIPTMTRSRAC
ncbi:MULTISPECIES: hypothetical protein [unclassified Sinorhizobium]|uniref:hypothetical protein n=1 Tax=unclassified Sinorhizobium TaxID=2613772 RepID=UPI0030155B0D